MSTSANVVNYRIFRDGKEVGSHRQNLLCKLRDNELAERFLPTSDFEIESWGYDEDEALWIGERENLQDWFVRRNRPISRKELIERLLSRD